MYKEKYSKKLYIISFIQQIIVCFVIGNMKICHNIILNNSDIKQLFIYTFTEQPKRNVIIHS